MTNQKVEQKPTAATPQETPRYLWHAGGLVEWDQATVHISLQNRTPGLQSLDLP